MGDAGGSPERSSAYLSCQLNMERKSQIVDPDRRVAGETESLPSSMLRVDRTEQEALAAPSSRCETKLSLAPIPPPFCGLSWFDETSPLPIRSEYEVLTAP